MSLENYNYYNDPRVANAGDNKAPVVFIDDDEIELPVCWIVCPTCNGKGSHVNPSIDAGGLTGSDFGDDPDFADSYMSGVFDQQCNQCGGRTTVPAVDRAACNPALLAAYDEQRREYYDDLACQRAELAMGC